MDPNNERGPALRADGHAPRIANKPQPTPKAMSLIEVELSVMTSLESTRISLINQLFTESSKPQPSLQQQERLVRVIKESGEATQTSLLLRKVFQQEAQQRAVELERERIATEKAKVARPVQAVADPLSASPEVAAPAEPIEQ